jgi:diketogulonate reductase-like aldo/keto reductase
MRPIKVPKIGLGTWKNLDPKQCAKTVKTALELGYRHIDTAQKYKNEEYVGDGIRQSNVDREEILLATKIWVDNLSYEKVKECTEKSLKRLGTDYIDIMYIHWPEDTYNAEWTLKALNELVDEGRIRNIGVSNFTPEDLEEASKHSENPMIANQIEMHPLNQQKEMRQYLKNKGIALVAYSPLARGGVKDIPELTDISKKYRISEAQVSLAWLCSYENVVAIPKASSKEHLRANLEAMEIILEKDDIIKIELLDEQKMLAVPPDSPDC